MKFLTLNIWNGGKIFPAVLEFLKTQAADIYFLQEVFQNPRQDIPERFQTTRWLKANFPDYSFAYSPALIDARAVEGDTEGGQAIISRWPLQNVQSFFPDVPFSRLDHDATTDFSHFPSIVQRADVTIQGQLVRLLNVHGPVNLEGLEPSERRQKFVATIQQHLSKNTIVAGDFNLQPKNLALQPLESQLVSVFKDTLPTTFNQRRKDLVRFPGYATASVDMIWTTPNFAVSAAKAWSEADVSDHLALSAEIALL